MDQCWEDNQTIRAVSIPLRTLFCVCLTIQLTYLYISVMISISTMFSMRPGMVYLLIPRVTQDLKEHTVLLYYFQMTLRIVSARSDLTMACLILPKCWCCYPLLLMKWSNSCACTQKFGLWIALLVSFHCLIYFDDV